MLHLGDLQPRHASGSQLCGQQLHQHFHKEGGEKRKLVNTGLQHIHLATPTRRHKRRTGLFQSRNLFFFYALKANIWHGDRAPCCKCCPAAAKRVCVSEICLSSRHQLSTSPPSQSSPPPAFRASPKTLVVVISNVMAQLLCFSSLAGKPQ